MHDVREPLNLAEDSVRGAERLAAGDQASGECSVRVEGPGGTAGTATVQQDGSFSFKSRQVLTAFLGYQLSMLTAPSMWRCSA